MALIDEVRIRDLRTLVEAASTCAAGKLLYPASTKRLERLGRLLERRLLVSSGQELTDTGWALVSRAATTVASADSLLDKDLRIFNLREQDHQIATACLELGLSAMRQDLSDEERARVLEVIKSRQIL
ncbi:MAG: hypothetical protein OXE83_01225 [Gammaproteobacteria bacterium]|nr:hypothetical protein [Gammaproteobacteria bacterium]